MATGKNIRQLLTRSTVDFETFMNGLKERDRNNDSYQFNRCDDRNIVLMGRTRTGKSTIAAVINDILHVASVPTLFSETKTIQFRSITTDTNGEGWYHFNIIDIPGFFDISVNEKERITNDRIISFLEEIMAKDITTIHLFAFVFNLAGGINERDLDTMIYLRKTYPHLAAHMALIITHCEQSKKEERDKWVNDFFRHPRATEHKLQDYFKRGVLFLGCFRHESVSKANETSMYYEYTNILEMRTKLIKTVIECSLPFHFYSKTGAGTHLCSIS